MTYRHFARTGFARGMGVFFLVLAPFQSRAGFVAYNFFGADEGAVSNRVTQIGVSGRLVLPAPIIFENFDGGTELNLGSVGWSEINHTDPVAGHTTTDPNDPSSNVYLGWTLLTRTRLASVFGDLRLQVAPGQEVNGQPVTQLLSGSLLYAESDKRSGNQVQYLFSPVYDLSGRSGVTLVLHSAYEQNQDSVAGIEYTVNRGETWEPVVYMLDRDDIIRLPDGGIDAVATFNTAYSDVATYTLSSGSTEGGTYGAFIAAPVTQALAPYVSGRINDDPVESKRVEVFRLPLADDQRTVQFRLFQAGTASWYWAVDDWGLYSVPYADQAVGTLKNYDDGSNTPVTMQLSVPGRELSAQLPLAAVTLPLQPGSDASRAFPMALDMAGATRIHPDQAATLDFTGLNPDQAYDLVLYSDKGAGYGSTGVTLRYTISGADGFRNESSQHPTLSVISGDQSETVTIDATDNSRADRGFICHFTAVRPGSDGRFRVTLASSQETSLNAMRLVESTPRVLSVLQAPVLTEHSATVTASLDSAAPLGLYLYWGATSGGENTNQWEHAVFLGANVTGEYTATLSQLETFQPYFYAFYASDGAGQAFWSEPGSFRPQLNGILYATSFEPDEPNPYTPGKLQGQDARGIWQVSQGNPVVQTLRAAHGLQSVQAGECTINVALTNQAPVLWVDAFFMESGTTNEPIVPTNTLSSALFFSASRGLLALDGDGAGGGQFVTVVSSWPTDTFVRVTIRNDYTAKRYEVWVDGILQRSNLGFKDNSVQKLSGAQRRSIQSNYMDDFSVSTWGLDQDSDGDGLVDLDEAKFYGSYPLLADSDKDGARDGAEVAAGTDPANPASVFSLKIQVDDQRQKWIRLPTITGRQYSLQRRRALSGGSWESLPNATNIPGDGTDKIFLETSDGQNYFYRGIIINR
jgi:hypothetical protein